MVPSAYLTHSPLVLLPDSIMLDKSVLSVEILSDKLVIVIEMKKKEGEALQPDVTKEKIDILDTRVTNHGKRIKKLEERDAVQTEKINRSEARIGDHGDRLKKVENSNVAQDVEIKHLCKDIKRMITAMYFVGGTILCALVGFFFYVVRWGALY